MKASLDRLCKDNSLGEHNPLPPFFKGELPTYLESMGLTVIRFNDAAVKVDLNNVLMAIEGWIERNNPLPPFSKGELPTHFEKEPK